MNSIDEFIINILNEHSLGLQTSQVYNLLLKYMNITLDEVEMKLNYLETLKKIRRIKIDGIYNDPLWRLI